MTVQTNTNVASFNGNGVTQIFPIAFKFNNDTDLVVALIDEASGAASRLTLNSDYTVSGEGDEEGGLINVTVAPSQGKRLKVARVVDILQLTDLRNQGKFFAEVHEDALDLLTMIAQQQETGISASIRVAEEDPTPERLPPAKTRANQLMGFDSNGNPIAVAPVSGSASELATNLADSADPNKGAALIGFDGGTLAEAMETLAIDLSNTVRKTSDTGAAEMPSGAPIERPESPSPGMVRHDSESDQFEGFHVGGWKSLAVAVDSSVTTSAGTSVNGAPLTKFGNMTTGGLSLLFDGLTGQAAISETPSGYAGVTLIAPAAISHVEVVSNTNGFDGSATANTATLTLYGKNGQPPVSATDGTVLGAATKADTNTQQTVTIDSSSAVAYQHVWVRIVTAVWAAASEIRIFTQKPIYNVGGGTEVYLSSCDKLVPLVSAGVELSPFRIPLYLEKPRVVLVDFHADVIHTGTGSDASVAVGFTFWVCYRSGASAEAMRSASFTNVRNAVGGGNVSEANPQHYGNKSITSAISLPAGYHEISILGNGHTDGSATQGILKVLAEDGMGLNALRVTVLP